MFSQLSRRLATISVCWTVLAFTHTLPFKPTTISKGKIFSRSFTISLWGERSLRGRKAESQNEVPSIWKQTSTDCPKVFRLSTEWKHCLNTENITKARDKWPGRHYKLWLWSSFHVTPKEKNYIAIIVSSFIAAAFLLLFFCTERNFLHPLDTLTSISLRKALNPQLNNQSFILKYNIQ